MLKLLTSCALGFRYGFGGMPSLPHNYALLKKTLIARNFSDFSHNNGPKNLKEALISFDRMVRLRPLPCCAIQSIFATNHTDEISLSCHFFVQTNASFENQTRSLLSEHFCQLPLSFESCGLWFGCFWGIH